MRRPGRSLPERASSSSLAFDGQAAQTRPLGSDGGRTGLPDLQLPLGKLRATGARAPAAAPGRAWWDTGAALFPAFVAAALAGLLLAKRGLLRSPLDAPTRRAAREQVRAYVADQGLELAPSLTPRELAAELERRFGVEAGAFAGALERAAYASPGGAGRPGAGRRDRRADRRAAARRSAACAACAACSRCARSVPGAR